MLGYNNCPEKIFLTFIKMNNIKCTKFYNKILILIYTANELFTYHLMVHLLVLKNLLVLSS